MSVWYIGGFCEEVGVDGGWGGWGWRAVYCFVTFLVTYNTVAFGILEHLITFALNYIFKYPIPGNKYYFGCDWACYFPHIQRACWT